MKKMMMLTRMCFYPIQKYVGRQDIREIWAGAAVVVVILTSIDVVASVTVIVTVIENDEFRPVFPQHSHCYLSLPVVSVVVYFLAVIVNAMVNVI